MSTKPYFPATASQAAGNSASGHRDKAFPAWRGTSIRTKAIIAAIVVAFVLLYAEGVTLMIDAADAPNPYTTFLHGAD